MYPISREEYESMGYSSIQGWARKCFNYYIIVNTGRRYARLKWWILILTYPIVLVANFFYYIWNEGLKNFEFPQIDVWE